MGSSVNLMDVRKPQSAREKARRVVPVGTKVCIDGLFFKKGASGRIYAWRGEEFGWCLSTIKDHILYAAWRKAAVV